MFLALDSVALVGFLALLRARANHRPIVEAGALADALRATVCSSVALCILAASLAGMPPFAGFWARIANFAIDAVHQRSGRERLLATSERGLCRRGTRDRGRINPARRSSGTSSKKMLLDDFGRTVDQVVQQPIEKSPRSRSETTAIFVGILAAWLVIAGGILPKPGKFHAAALGTSEERAFQPVFCEFGKPARRCRSERDGGRPAR